MKKKKSAQWNFPPDVFWITPAGAVYDIIGHLSSIQEAPERFGFMFAPTTHNEIDAAINTLLQTGWVRGRVSGDKVLFQVWSITPANVRSMFNFVFSYRAFINDVAVDVMSPRRAWEMSASEFAEQRYPVAWLINPGKKRR